MCVDGKKLKGEKKRKTTKHALTSPSSQAINPKFTKPRWDNKIYEGFYLHVGKETQWIRHKRQGGSLRTDWSQDTIYAQSASKSRGEIPDQV